MAQENTKIENPEVENGESVTNIVNKSDNQQDNTFSDKAAEANADVLGETGNEQEDSNTKQSAKKRSKVKKSKADKLTQENEELKYKLAEAQDKYLRLFSEFDNYRKRTNKEKIEILGSASGALIKELLPVVDDMDRAEANFDTTDDMKALSDGVVLIFSKFRKTLKSKGLEEIESTGKEFDTDTHEAIAQFPAPEDSMKNKVIETTEKGYTINGKVLRHAKVVVGV